MCQVRVRSLTEDLDKKFKPCVRQQMGAGRPAFSLKQMYHFMALSLALGGNVFFLGLFCVVGAVCL